jgi:hypothetical protein
MKLSYAAMPTWLLRLILQWDYLLRRLKLRKDVWHDADIELGKRGQW